MSAKKIKKVILRPDDAPFYQHDQLIGFWGRPNMEREVRFKDKKMDFILARHNSEGNRDKSVSTIRGNGILCFGGSHTWGVGIDQESRYSEHIEKMTGKPVYNLGHCSLGLDQICLAILNKVERYRPSIIIIEQYPWAIHRVLSSYVIGYCRPYFYLDNKGDLKLKKLPMLSRFTVFRRIIGEYHSYRKEFYEFKAGINLSEGYNPWTDPIFLYWKTSYYDYMYNLVEKILGVIKDYCRQHGIRLLFGLEPIKQQFGNGNPSDLIDYDLPRKRLKAALAKNQIPTLDLSEVMITEHSTDDPVIFNDGHMNEKGHGIFAREIVKYMKENRWI